MICARRRKTLLAGVAVLAVRASYSTATGNLWFDAPDTCAAGVEIARRGFAACGT